MIYIARAAASRDAGRASALAKPFLTLHLQDKPARYRNLWILCRDMEELNPAVAWKVMEVHEVKEELTM